MPAIPNIMGGWGRAPSGGPTFPSYLSQQATDFLSGLQPNPTTDLSGQAFQPYSWNTPTSQGQIIAPAAGSLSSAYIVANGVDTAPGWQERMYAWGKANIDRLPDAAKRAVQARFGLGTTPTVPTVTPPATPAITRPARPSVATETAQPATPMAQTRSLSVPTPTSGANPFQIMQQAQATATPQFPNYTPFQFNRQLPTRPEAWDLNRKQKRYFQT